MTDPTTRDPAASLARCIELAAKARGLEQVGGSAWADAYRDERRALAAFLRDDAPALLARIAEAEAERDAWKYGDDARCDLLRARAEAAEQVARDEKAYAADAAARVLKAELAQRKAEQVAREAVALAEYVKSWILTSSAVPPLALANQLATFLAHHGARTGESND